MNPQNAQSVYREIDIQGATPLQLVVALYDAVLQDIRGAIAAQKHNDIEERTAQVKHCLLALGQLQGRLDFERGGEVAQNLDRFYSTVRGKLLEASMKASADTFAAIADMVMTVRSAWNEAATEQLRQQRRTSEPAGLSDASPPPAPDEAAAHSGWTA
ncbi:MAG: flagellar export chaperone FliS [Candidatus Korobacteraceae bacterium]|jgi:flagellar protein FliS